MTIHAMVVEKRIINACEGRSDGSVLLKLEGGVEITVFDGVVKRIVDEKIELIGREDIYRK